MWELGNYRKYFSCNKSETQPDTTAPECTCAQQFYLGSNPAWSTALALSQRSHRREEKDVWGFVWGKIKEIIVLKKGEIGISLAAQVAQEHFKLLWLVSFIWQSSTCLKISHLGFDCLQSHNLTLRVSRCPYVLGRGPGVLWFAVAWIPLANYICEAAKQESHFQHKVSATWKWGVSTVISVSPRVDGKG